MQINCNFVLKYLVLIGMLLTLNGCTVLGLRDIPLETLKEKYANEESKFMHIRGVDLHYRDEGPRDAPVLILMHGVVSSLHVWDGWTEELKDKYRIIRFDIPTFGLTGPIKDGEFSAEYAVDFLHQFVTNLELDQFYLAGNSLGAYIAWNYSLVYPDKVIKMVLLDPVGYEHDMPFFMAFLATPVIGDITRFIAPKFIVSFFTRGVYGDPDKVPQEIYDRYFEMMLRPGNRAAMVDFFKGMKRLRDIGGVGDRIKDITVPTLLMWGEKDTFVPVAQLDRWKKDLPGVPSRVYPGVGHVSMEESPINTSYDAHQFFMASDHSLSSTSE